MQPFKKEKKKLLGAEGIIYAKEKPAKTIKDQNLWAGDVHVLSKLAQEKPK